MKKLLIASLSLVIVSSCKKDDPVAPVDPVNNIVLKEEFNALSLMGTVLHTSIGANNQIASMSAESEFKQNLNHMTFVGDKTSPFYNPLIDTLMAYYGNPQPPYYIVNDIQIPPGGFPLGVYDEIEMSLMNSPIASVGHVVQSDDTSWVIDSKVKFWVDTTVQPEVFMIETYLLEDIQARNFTTQNLDLRFPAVKDFILNPPTDSVSYWDIDLYNSDSSAYVVRKGQKAVNQYLCTLNANKKNFFGTPLSTYWPFAGDFHKGDIIGTPDTRIRVHLAKTEKGEYDFNRKVSFITVLWMWDAVNGRYDYVNSYSSETRY